MHHDLESSKLKKRAVVLLKQLAVETEGWKEIKTKGAPTGA